MEMVAGANTTIAIVATDADLTKAQAQRLATAAQDGIARAIVPAHGPMDGDGVCCRHRQARPDRPRLADAPDVPRAAATTLSRAIARAIYHARRRGGRPFTWHEGCQLTLLGASARLGNGKCGGKMIYREPCRLDAGAHRRVCRPY